MNRREFLKGTAAATALLSLPSFATVFALGSCAPKAHTLPEDLADVSPDLQSHADALFDWIRKNGWADYLETLNLSLPASTDVHALSSLIPEGALQALVKTKGFEDFAGNKLIEPGFPAMSLLYHLLANPRVKPGGFTEAQYPELAQLDLLEDFIYALLNWSAYQEQYNISGTGDLVLAVFAYEYRTAFKTPHHQHADMVFSRTGIGRIGSHAQRYDGPNRCYTNNPSGKPGDKHIAVVPARYGLFVAKKVPCKDQSLSLMSMSQRKYKDRHYLHCDSEEYVLLPVRKVFNRDLLIDSAELLFEDDHESRKIANLLDDKSLIRKSADLVTAQTLRSSLLMLSKPAPLITPLRDKKNHIRTFTAVPDNNDNRYFTAYFNDTIVKTVEDIEITDSTGMLRSSNEYKNPRNSPMYVHLGHHLSDETTYVYTGRSAGPDQSFEDVIGGKRIAPLFEDRICDGSVSVKITIGSGPLAALSAKGVLRAFSIITAPDFLPQVDNFDLQEFDVAPGRSKEPSLFFEGGIASLANCDIPPNPLVYHNDPGALSAFNPQKTYTAVISAKDRHNGRSLPIDFRSPETGKDYVFSSYLPDMCSSVFAPGWDVTYSAPKLHTDKGVFLSTQGLGSPFVEDMKLCAAMNGMWPAASPDASRTYQGSVTDKQNKGPEWERNPTAIPLMDDEIGFADDSPAVKEHALKVSYGWDGEQGPFIEQVKEKTGTQWHVNFTDLGRADYVENALHDALDMSKLRELDSQEVHHRAFCLRRCLNEISPAYIPNGANSLWLVSAEKADWMHPAKGYGLTKALLSQTSNGWAVKPRAGISGPGYLFVFAAYTPDAHSGAIRWVDHGDHTKRRRVPCEKIYVCQATKSKVAYYSIDVKTMNAYDASHWKFAGA